MSAAETTFGLRIGESLRFNFPGAPGARGTFLGFTDFGWIALEVYDREGDDRKVTYYNLANLNAITPESDPHV